ncbi:MAG TPA: hypothetical protein VFW14_06265 [Gaiellales bacterium]|nr:hypothetical protein [Gaiellales bacterium]
MTREHPEEMATAGAGRPTRGSLERRLTLLKRSVVVAAVGSFAAVASLAAARTAAHGASTPAQRSNQQNQYQDGQDDYFGHAPYGDGSGSSGSLGSGSGTPPAAGSHAS